MKFFNKKGIVIILFLTVSTASFAINTTSDIANLFKANSLIIVDDGLLNIKNLLAAGETKKALEELYLYIENVAANKNSTQVIEGKILLADILRDNGDYKKSNEIFNEVIPLILNNRGKLQYVYFKKGGNFQLDNEIDSAKVNYEKAIFYADEIEGNQDLKAKMHANLSGIFYLNGDYEKSIEHSKIAVNFQKELGNTEIEAGILNNLGGIYYMKGDFKNALSTFNEAFELVGYGQSELQKKTRTTSFINIAYAHSGLGDFEKAFEFQDKYFSLNDSLQQELKYKEIAEIESKYQVATKEKEAIIEKTKRKEAELLTYGLGIAILILLSGIYALYKLIKLNRNNHALQINQEQLLNQNKLDKIKSESQSKILVATMDGKIQERKKISAILHGNVSALLSAANLNLYASEMQFNGNVPEEIKKAQGIITEASVQVRELSHTLISAILLKQGLEAAVKDICKKSSNPAIHLNCESKNMIRFDNDFEIKIFNVVQELINNMLKHSNAKSGTVKLEQLEGALQVLVVDNGKGFNVNEENIDAGIGLSQIKARIKNLNGVLNMSSLSNGTRIYISVPIVY